MFRPWSLCCSSSASHSHFEECCLFEEPIQTLCCNVKLAGSMKYPYLFAKHSFVWSAWICLCDIQNMITCPVEALIRGSNSNLLKMKESPVPVTQWVWLSPPVLQQTATCQATIAFCLHPESYKLLIVSFISKCWLQLKFQTSYYFHKSYSYCLWPPQLPIFETSFVQLSMPSSPDLSSALYQMEICNVLLLLCKHSGNSNLAENVSLSKASIRILCSR